MHNIVLVINYDRGSNPNTTRTILCYVSLNTEAAGSLTPQSICTPSFPSDTGTDSWHREMKERRSLLILQLAQRNERAELSVNSAVSTEK